MLLSTYLAEKGLSFRAFAISIGTKHARTVERYAKGQSIPNKVMMARVVEVTAGQVTANDFYEIEPRARAAEAKA